MPKRLLPTQCFFAGSDNGFLYFALQLLKNLPGFFQIHTGLMQTDFSPCSEYLLSCPPDLHIFYQ